MRFFLSLAVTIGLLQSSVFARFVGTDQAYSAEQVVGANGRAFLARDLAEDGTVSGSIDGSPALWSSVDGPRSLATGENATLKGAGMKVAKTSAGHTTLVQVSVSSQAPREWRVLEINSRGQVTDRSVVVNPKGPVRALDLRGMDETGSVLGNMMFKEGSSPTYIGPAKFTRGTISKVAPPKEMNGALLDSSGQWSCGILVLRANAAAKEQAAVCKPSGQWVLVTDGQKDVTESSASAISSSGETVGSFIKAGKVYPFLWSPSEGGAFVQLGESSGEALDINDSGTIVGHLGDKAMLYDRSQNRWIEIDSLTNAKDLRFRSALSINAKGQILALSSDGVYYVLTPGK